MHLSHTPAALSISFDDLTLVSAASLVPVMFLADTAGLSALAQHRMSIAGDKGANAGAKITTLVAGMVAGADSIDDMDLLRHGGMSRLFTRTYAPSTLGFFLRAFTFGHVRQLDAVASCFLTNLADQSPSLVPAPTTATSGYVFFGYSGVRGLNALLATVTTTESAPVVVAQRLRRGSCGSARGAGRLIADAITTTRRLPAMAGHKILMRADSAFYGSSSIHAALTAGADVSVTMRMDPNVKRAIATIADDAWTPIRYTDALFDEDTGRWISSAEVTEIPFTAFASKNAADQVPGRLVVRRIPELSPKKDVDQPGLFDLYRFHAVFTTSGPGLLDTVAVDKTHRQHAIIEQVNADLKASALAHMPSGKFTANSAWLVAAVMAFNLTRTAVAARVSRRSRRLVLHLPEDWNWEAQ